MPRNARFLVCIDADSDATVTLSPGQTLTHNEGGPHEEGWWGRSTTWTHDGTGVYREWSTDGSDCDGRTGTSGEDYCPLADLRAHEGCAGVMFPKWDAIDARQYDQFAEAAGY